MPLPPILAGPIIRRVEPISVSVWIALSKKQMVQLVLWDDNEVEAGQEGEVIPQAGNFVKSEVIETLEIANQLHIVVLTIDTSQQKLREDRIYCYNIYFGDTATTLTNDLGTAGLLKIKKSFNDKLTEGVPLGYNIGRLPTIIIPNSSLENLNVAHGSCRKIHGIGDEAFRHLDKFVQKNLGDTQKRVQQLFLTGDQIYADETPKIVLPFINQLGKEIFGDKIEALAFEVTANSNKTIPADLAHFPSACRQKVVNDSAKFTGNGISSHLLSFPEYCSTYLHYWSVDVWSEPLKLMLVKFKGSNYNEDVGSFIYYYLVNIFKDLEIEDMFELVFTFKDEAEGATKKANLLSVKGLLLGSVPTNLSAEQTERINALETLYTANFETSFPGFNDIVKMMKIVETMSETDRNVLSNVFNMGGVLEESQASMDFLEVLPLARRVLANIPTSMIFDDHEVTDDWFFSQFWKNRVLTSPLGVQVMRNALMAYTLFQDWGNVPNEYPLNLLNLPAQPAADLQTQRENYLSTIGKNKGDKIILLQKITEYGKALSAGNQPTPAQPLPESLDRFFFFGEAAAEGEVPAITSPVRWHYNVPSGPAHTFFLDTRTRREYDEFTGPPGLLSKKALDEQLPESIADENHALVFVISPVPALGLPVLEEFAQPVVGLVEGGFSGEGVGGAPEGAISGALKRDVEAWGFSERHVEQLLNRLAQFKKVAILSGDIHYGYAAFADHWKARKEENHARIIQLVSSSFKQGWSLEFVLLKSGFAQRLLAGFDYEFEKHGWKDKSLKVNGVMAPRHRNRLRRNPVVLPRHGWHHGTTTDPVEPDWAWRLRIAVDETTYENIPEFPALHLEVDKDLPEEGTSGDANEVKNTYLQMAARHNALFKMGRTRRLIWQPHFGHIFFTKSPEDANRMVLNHEYHYTCRTDGILNDDEAPDLNRAGLVSGPFTLHAIDLDVSAADKTPPPTLNDTPEPA
ncbi:MAG: hypothetical protein DHS20C18_53570 [Saprospiraceae bacterium]|nr:MAG: hypothetical protein DHS20C18_53570 [Saprospiraceae bacterium]